MTNYISVDAGFGNTRLYGTKGSVILHSLVATNGTRDVSAWASGDLKRSKVKPLLIRTDQGDFYVGPGAHQAGRPVENLDLDRMTGPETLALFYGALTNYKPPATATLIIALPIALAQGTDGDRVKDQAKSLLMGDHAWRVADPDGGKDKRYRLTVDDVIVTSQPACLMFDHLINAQGVITPDKQALRKTATLGYASIGFNTIELMIVEDGRMIVKTIAGEQFGVRRLLELLNGQGAYSLGELDEKLRADKLDYSVALPRWQRDVLGQFEKHWEAQLQRRLKSIYIGGGGVFLMRAALLSKFKDRLFIPDDPLVCIARGGYKYALMKYGHGD